MKHAGLKLKPKKCFLFQTKVKYLGHVVSQNGVETDPEKIKAIVDQEVNKKVAEIKKKEDKTKKTVDKKAAVKEKKEDKKKQVA